MSMESMERLYMLGYGAEKHSLDSGLYYYVLLLDDCYVMFELYFVNHFYVIVYRFKLGIPVTLKF